MGNPFLLMNTQEKRKILVQAAVESGQFAEILEKDIMLCWVLQTLFSIPDHHPMAFKGGTSLSKVYGIIDRFSEDVDITLDCRAHEDDFDPFAEGVSRTKIKKYSAHLKEFVESYINDAVVPVFEEKCKTLDDDGEYRIQVQDGGERVLINYPSVIHPRSYYISREIILEFGGRNEIIPNEQHTIEPEIVSFTKEVDYPVATVNVLAPSRTFWEKATLIHVACNRGRLTTYPNRLSRHWYDLVRLTEHDLTKEAINDRSLLEAVVRHKKLFFNASYCHYDECLVGRLRLVPDEASLESLQSDYEAMRESRMLNDDAPNFNAIIEQIKAIEVRVNCWS